MQSWHLIDLIKKKHYEVVFLPEDNYKYPAFFEKLVKNKLAIANKDKQQKKHLGII